MNGPQIDRDQVLILDGLEVCMHVINFLHCVLNVPETYDYKSQLHKTTNVPKWFIT